MRECSTDYGYGRFTKWQPITKVLPWTRGMLGMPDCCYCRRPASDLEARDFIVTTKDINQIPCCGTPPPQFRCKPGKGCNAEPWSRAGSELRSMMWDGPPPFKRISDGKYFGMAE